MDNLDYRSVLNAIPFKPLTRPPIPASAKLAPAVCRSAWLDRARRDHWLFRTSMRILDQYDHELQTIADELGSDLMDFDTRLAAALEHYSEGVRVIEATRTRIAGALAGGATAG